jgi:hypothetical protein
MELGGGEQTAKQHTVSRRIARETSRAGSSLVSNMGVDSNGLMKLDGRHLIFRQITFPKHTRVELAKCAPDAKQTDRSRALAGP